MALKDTTALAIKGILGLLGRRVVNSIYPNEVEYYMLSLELCNSENTTIDFFTFPVMPDSITESKSPIVNIKRTIGGISVISSGLQVPVDINIAGTFGRGFKFLVGREKFNGMAAYYQNTVGGATGKPKEFSKIIKTGYGCTKVLEEIVNKSNYLDNRGKPNNLYLYNTVSGNSYLVKVTNFQISQAINSNNMMWNYTIALKGLVPIEGLEGRDLETGLSEGLNISTTMKVISGVQSQLLKQVKILTT
jgi:hypothetical protein